jgi:hypothetical protein
VWLARDPRWGGGGRVGAGGGWGGAGARSARARSGAAGKVCACVGENRERQNRAPICCVDAYTINLISSRYIYIYIYGRGNGSPGLPLLERAPARLGVRAWGDVAGGGITACMHRVKGGEFMHTEFESNKCVNGNGGARVRRRGSRVYACVFCRYWLRSLCIRNFNQTNA